MRPSEVQEMGFDEVRLLTKYWEAVPPTHASVAMFLGTGTKPKATQRKQTDEDIAQALAELGVSFPKKG